MKTVRLTANLALPPGTVAEVSNEFANTWEAEGALRVVSGTDEPTVLNLPDGVDEADVLKAIERLARKAAREGE